MDGSINRTSGSCQLVKRLKTFNEESNFYDKARSIVGSSVGQAAFKYVTGNIPKVQVDKNVGFAMTQLVDSVNSGARSFAGQGINQVTQTVFETAGINPGLVPADPNGQNIYNNATQAAEFVGGQLLQGAMDKADLPGPVGQLSALAFVQQQQAQRTPQELADPACGISAYARDLIKYAPKFNFMFMVNITFQPAYQHLGVQEHNKIDPSEEIQFKYLCKYFSRPNISVEYEDINMYNFRSKVATKVTYEPLTLRLYDDMKNSSLTFFEKYLKTRSPIARRHPNESNIYEQHGMNFDQQTAGSGSGPSSELQGGSGTLGGLLPNPDGDGHSISIIKNIEVYQIFDYGRKINRYTFINPKITQFDLSDFDMENSTEPSYIEIQSAYDSMFIETDIAIDDVDVEEHSKLGQRYIRKYYEK